VRDLGQALKELELEGNYFAEFSLTVVIYDLDLSKAEATCADFYKVFSIHDAQLYEERYNLLKTFSSTNKNTAVSLVVKDSELADAVAKSVSGTDPSSPATIKDVSITIDGSGLHMTGNIVTPLGTFASTADVIAGPVNGKLQLRLRNLSAGQVPGPILDQLQRAVEQGLNDFTDTFPMTVRQVALRPGCLGVMGTTPQ